MGWLRVAPCLEVLSLLAFDRPLASNVPRFSWALAALCPPRPGPSPCVPHPNLTLTIDVRASAPR
jgi:hypothetical protein